ncbi:MAG: ABC transporter substrate-binding protein [Clostridiales bacterium]|nr:ABC transporter substrate-binding protein [Clostridiales bacterium]
MKNHRRTLAGKLFSLCALTAAAALLTSGCSGKDSQNGTETIHMGIIQHTDNDSFTQMREALINRLRELGYDESQLEIDYQNAQGDMSNVNTICQKMASDKKDLLVPVVTPSTQAAVAMDSGIPIIFMSVTDPLAAKVMTDLNKPGNEVTGTSNAIPVDEIFKLAARLTPHVKTYGIIYNTGEVNSVATVNSAKQYLAANDLSYVETVVTNASEVQQAAESLVGRVDAIFTPLDSMVNSAMPQVAQIAKDAKLPVYTAADTMVHNGGFATVGVSYEKIGIMTADMIDRYLKGTPIADMPCETLSEFSTVINQTTAGAIGVTIPDDMAESADLVG